MKQTAHRGNLRSEAAAVGLHAAYYRGTWRVLAPREGFRTIGGRRLSERELMRIIAERKVMARNGRRAA